MVWTLHNQDGNTQCDQNWFLQNWLENNVNWLEKNVRAWSLLFFFLSRLVHSLMTTLERNSLFMLEMTTRVLGDCWITSIKKLSLISLVESAWYEYKLLHIATYLCFLKLLFSSALTKGVCKHRVIPGVAWRWGLWCRIPGSVLFSESTFKRTVQCFSWMSIKYLIKTAKHS